MSDIAIYDDKAKTLHVLVPKAAKKVMITMAREKDMEFHSEELVFQRKKIYHVKGQQEASVVFDEQNEVVRKQLEEIQRQKLDLENSAAEMKRLCESLQKREDDWKRKEQQNKPQPIPLLAPFIACSSETRREIVQSDEKDPLAYEGTLSPLSTMPASDINDQKQSPAKSETSTDSSIEDGEIYDANNDISVGWYQYWRKKSGDARY